MPRPPKKTPKLASGALPESPDAEAGDAWGILGPDEWSFVLGGPEAPRARVPVPDAAKALGRPLRKGERKDVILREPTQEQREAHRHRYKKLLRTKATPRAKTALRQLWKLTANTEAAWTLDVLTAGDVPIGEREPVPELHTPYFELLLREAAAAVGWMEAPPERGGRGEYLAQRWIAALQQGLRERYAEGAPGPEIEIRLPPVPGGRLTETLSLGPYIQEQRERAQERQKSPQKIRDAARRAPRQRSRKSEDDTDRTRKPDKA